MNKFTVKKTVRKPKVKLSGGGTPRPIPPQKKS